MERSTANDKTNIDLDKLIKKKKVQKDLEELRRNALATKRNLRKKTVKLQRSKNSLIKSLNEFSSKRQEIENAVQCQNSLLNRSKMINDTVLPKPLIEKGFIQAGIKGKKLTRPSDSEVRFKNAVLQGDALQLMQGDAGTYSKLQHKQHFNENDSDPHVKMEIKKILKNIFDSSDSDTDDSDSIKMVKSSPALSGVQSLKRKLSHLKPTNNKTLKNNFHKYNHSSIANYIAKEKKCKRQLFEEKNATSDNNLNEYIKNNEFENVGTIRNSTPENVIFFTNEAPLKNVNNIINNNQNNNKINPDDPQLIKYYVETCKIIAEKDFKDIFWDALEDPIENAKITLKNTYTSTFKEFLHRQNNKSERKINSVDRVTISSSSETMLEPDSVIARTLKKNIKLQSKDDCSEIEAPVSTKGNIDPDSAKIELKMNSILPECQELMARYLKDVETYNEKEKNICNSEHNIKKHLHNHHFEREKLYINENNTGTYFIRKSTKYVPAILRKSRSFLDCIAKDKVSITEKHPRSNEVINKTLVQDLTINNNLKNERTPNCGNTSSNQLIEAPKCKYMYMNAKYNQPPRINISSMQNKKFQKKKTPEKNLFLSPVNTGILLIQKYEVSPIQPDLNILENKNNFYLCTNHQISEGNAEEENHCMTRMLSFGDIQEQTDRLTLRSSQGQNCSQESMKKMHSFQEELRDSHHTFVHQQCNGSSFCNTYNNPACVELNKVPTSKNLNVATDSNYNYLSHNASEYVNEIPCVKFPGNHFQTGLKHYAFQSSKDFDNSQLNNCQVCKKQSLQHIQETSINYAPIQQRMCQPLKFIAVEENRMPQRHPVYGNNDDNSCSHLHKKSVPNSQYIQVRKPHYSADISNQSYGAMFKFHEQPIPQPIVSSNFKRANPHKVNNSTNNNILNYNSEVPEFNRSFISHIPNETLITQPNLTVHTIPNNQRCIGQHTQLPSSIYSQVEYQYYRNNEGNDVNDVYLQKINRNHCKRP